MALPTVIEQQIVDALHQVPFHRWEEVLAFIASLQPHEDHQAPPKSRWTAAELRTLPADQRDAILAEQAALMEQEYRTNPELTGFEAFGQDDLYVDSSDTTTR
jgi:hypothetical protein